MFRTVIYHPHLGTFLRGMLEAFIFNPLACCWLCYVRLPLLAGLRVDSDAVCNLIGKSILVTNPPNRVVRDLPPQPGFGYPRYRCNPVIRYNKIHDSRQCGILIKKGGKVPCHPMLYVSRLCAWRFAYTTS